MPGTTEWKWAAAFSERMDQLKRRYRLLQRRQPAVRVEGMVKAITYDQYGDIGQMHFAERPREEPREGEVLVRVVASALNPIDWKMRQGQVRWVYPLKFPVIPGRDFCGTIVQCGNGVEGFAAGDRVCGMSDQRVGGALAEELTCSSSVLVKVPDSMSEEEAAGLPLAGLTALQGLRDQGKFARDMRVLVVGASGGVGHLVVQLASHWGGRVTAVCGPANQEWVAALGPEKVLDYGEPNWLREAGNFDLIFDAVGVIGFSRSRRHLARGGSYVTTLPGLRILIDQWVTAPLWGCRARMFLVKPSGEDLRTLIEAWEGGHLRVRVAGTFDWSEYPAAFAQSESGHADGKVVLRIAS